MSDVVEEIFSCTDWVYNGGEDGEGMIQRPATQHSTASVMPPLTPNLKRGVCYVGRNTPLSFLIHFFHFFTLPLWFVVLIVFSSIQLQ